MLLWLSRLTMMQRRQASGPDHPGERYGSLRGLRGDLGILPVQSNLVQPSGDCECTVVYKQETPPNLLGTGGLHASSIFHDNAVQLEYAQIWRPGYARCCKPLQ